MRFAGAGPEPGAEVTAPRRPQDTRMEGLGVPVGVLREGTVDLEKHGMKRGVRSPVGSRGGQRRRVSRVLTGPEGGTGLCDG